MANEKRLINVNPAYIQHILSKVPYYADEIWKFTCMTQRFPTVDAVEVVRCKDCKHWQESVDGIHKWCPLMMSKETKPDDFCSYGERK